MIEAEVLLIIADFIWLKVYAPFTTALILICAFFWRLHESQKQNSKKMIDEKFNTINTSQDKQTVILKEISGAVNETKITSARLDERMKTVEDNIERRREPRQ